MTGVNESTSRSKIGNWTVGLGKADMPMEASLKVFPNLLCGVGSRVDSL